MKIIESSIERALYILLFLVFASAVVIFIMAVNLLQRQQVIEKSIQASTKTVEAENYCLVSFFLQPDRTQITLKNLQACRPVVP